MSETPQRIQRKRTKGWKMPEGAVYVGRPTLWGNPFTPEAFWLAGYSGDVRAAVTACVIDYKAWLCDQRMALDWRTYPEQKPGLSIIRAMLRGRDLACWCQLDQPCHADVLLEIANR